MLECYINGLTVFPDLDNRIDIVKSNAALGNVGSFSYEIVFDLSVGANAVAFAGLNRLNYAQSEQLMLELRIDGRMIIKGAAIVLKVAGNKVSVQATEGELSAKVINSDKLVRDLDLGTFPNLQNVSDITACNWSTFPEYEVCFPLLTDSEDTLHEWEVGDSSVPSLPNGMYDRFLLNLYYQNAYNQGTRRLMQPYLLAIVKRVFAAFGYDADFSEFLAYGNNWIFKKLFVVADARNYYAGSYEQVGFKWEKMLPYWTVSKFFSEVKKFLNCAFVFDEMNMTVKLVSRQMICREGLPVVIPLSDILQKKDAHEIDTVEEDYDGDANYVNFGYNLDNNDEYMKMQNLEKVLIDKCQFAALEFKDNFRPDAYVIFDDLEGGRFVNLSDKGLVQVMTMQDVINEEEADVMRMDIIPANSRLINFSFKDNNNRKMKVGMIAALVPQKIGEKTPIFPAKLSEALNGGISYLQWPNVMHVAFKSETNTARVFEDILNLTVGQYARGWSGVESFTFPRYEKEQWADEDGAEASAYYNLAPSRMMEFYEDTYSVDRSKEYVIRFLSKDIPEVSSVFLINGRRFACKEIKVFVEQGKRAKFLEGIFYAFV